MSSGWKTKNRGKLITYIHHADIGHFDRIPLYLWRRFSRIFPIYWVYLILSILVISLGRLATGKRVGFDIGLSDIAGTVFLIIGAGDPKYVGVAWTLQFEVLFYLAFCLMLISSRIGAVAFCAWGLFVIGHAYGITNISLPLNLGDAHCLQFLFGVAVGICVRRYRLKLPKTTLIAVLLLFLVAVIFEVYGPFGRHSVEGRIALGLASGAVIAILAFLEIDNAIRTPEWLVRIGSVSYSIYLGHFLFISLTYSVLLKQGVFHTLPEAFVLASAIGVAILINFAIGMFVELPLVRVLKGLFSSIDQAR